MLAQPAAMLRKQGGEGGGVWVLLQQFTSLLRKSSLPGCLALHIEKQKIQPYTSSSSSQSLGPIQKGHLGQNPARQTKVLVTRHTTWMRDDLSAGPPSPSPSLKIIPSSLEDAKVGAEVKAGPSPALSTSARIFSHVASTWAFGHWSASQLQETVFGGGPPQGKTVNMPSRNRGDP